MTSQIISTTSSVIITIIYHSHYHWNVFLNLSVLLDCGLICYYSVVIQVMFAMPSYRFMPVDLCEFVYHKFLNTSHKVLGNC